ncbi:class I SAM-dependent methyltransferase [Candidatus Chloroploca sp. M-50]|uniref:Class I SAM-dependent methyltransferase n=1 Tax=Candidatus Chloroploca mongolica TaxID=2528176 RepID=A0ABS4D8I9_9CHLR|nr:class I SAM-dependent methyltransferase [Candidatus Chloroploca mongolica]MBP1465725.1 class I SAM-dependent methyltransferase [Candidatus Chloroploca mongolica]
MLSILDGKYGHWHSVKTRESIGIDGEPTPWYTYPAIEYLDQLDFTEKTVFEWGAGNSSRYWARSAKSVVSVEDDPIWYRKIQQYRSDNLDIHLIQDKQRYIDAIRQNDQKYDVIIVDGSYRHQCALIAPLFLREGGVIVLDNSDWYPDSAKFLRDAGLLQVDFSGFVPVALLTSTTSLFFRRDFSVSSKSNQQPRPSLGSVPAPQNIS